MITRIAIHNFRTLENFEIKLTELNLFMGANGSGKTSVFDALRLLQRFLKGGCNIGDVFIKRIDFTRWLCEPELRIELDMSLPEGEFTYSICMEHKDWEEEARVREECLKLDGRMLYSRKFQQVELFNDNYNAGPTYASDWRLSVLNTFPERDDNRKTIAFRRQIERLLVVGFDPFVMESDSRKEDKALDFDSANFTSWYRKIMGSNLDKLSVVFNALKNGPMPNFHSYSFHDSGVDVKTFYAHFLKPGKPDETHMIHFAMLSSGQKILLILYILLFGVKNREACLFLDEPDNFVTLREIQPWLVELREAQGGAFRQMTLISHHPHVIDEVGVSGAQLFFRENGGKTRLKDYRPLLEDSPLALSEHVARGNLE